MEEDEETTKTFPPWVELEYAVSIGSLFHERYSTRDPLQHMRILAGQGAQVCFTHLSRTSSDSLSKIFGKAPMSEALAHTSCHQISVLDLMEHASVPTEKVCLLDPKSKEELSPSDGDGRFSWFLFGVRIYVILSSTLIYLMAGNTWFARLRCASMRC